MNVISGGAQCRKYIRQTHTNTISFEPGPYFMDLVPPAQSDRRWFEFYFTWYQYRVSQRLSDICLTAKFRRFDKLVREE